MFGTELCLCRFLKATSHFARGEFTVSEPLRQRPLLVGAGPTSLCPCRLRLFYEAVACLGINEIFNTDHFSKSQYCCQDGY